MFSFFKRSKSHKSKQKQDRTQQANAAKSAALGACVANPAEETPLPPPSPTMQLDQDASAVSPPSSSPSCSGNGGEGESVKNKQRSPPTATSILTSPNDIIRENGRSFGLEDGVIEFVDEGEADDDDNDEDAINECEDPRPRQRGEQSTSTNQNANLLESTMAKGKNKRRYQGGKNIQQQQQQQHQGQKQSNKENHLLELKQACNVTTEKINLEGETKQPVAVVTASDVTQSAENVTKVHEGDDSKVNHSEQHNSKQEEPKVKIVSQNTDLPCVLTAGDVNGKNAEDHEDKNSIVPRSEAVNNKPSLAEDCQATNDAGVSEDPTQTVTSPIPLTQTDTTLDVVGGGNELLNSTASSVAQPCPTAELHSSTNTESHEIKDGPREPSASSETVTSEHVTSSNEEMGQQPSKPSEPLNNNCRRSSTPNRQPPPPTLIIQPALLQPPAKAEDAARDDISDDRDVFYEATESLSPGTPAAASLDQTEPPLPPVIPTTKEASPLKAIIVSPNQSEPRASPKKRVVFSEQLIIEGKPLQEFDLCNSASSSANSSTESLPNALNLEAPSYEEHLVQTSAPNSLVNNNNHKNSVNIVLCVGNDPPHAFNSDNSSGISPSVPPPPVIITPKPNLIEFKYNSSDDSSLHNGHKNPDKEESKRRSQSLPILGSKVGAAEDTISLPDVVQPSDKSFNTVDKLNSEM